MDVALFLTGIAIGLSVTAPVGPVNVIVIRTAIRRNFPIAFVTGLGAVAADMVYASLAAWGVRSIEHLIISYATILTVLGGVLLVFMGVRLARAHVSLAALAALEPPTRRQILAKALTTFTLTLTNPGVFFGFLAIFGTMSAVLNLAADASRPFVVVAGAAAGGTLWWLFLSYVVAHFRTRITEKALDRINRWTGILIAAFGFALLMDALF
jgi:threonine/homoserine/homoserine lactone efflux protein